MEFDLTVGYDRPHPANRAEMESIPSCSFAKIHHILKIVAEITTVFAQSADVSKPIFLKF